MRHIFSFFFIVMVIGINTGAFCANNDVPDMSDLLEGLEDELEKEAVDHAVAAAAAAQQEAVLEETEAAALMRKAQEERRQERRNRMFFKEVIANDVEAVQKWIAQGVDVTVRNQTGHTLLHVAALYGAQQVLHYLLTVIPELRDAQDNKGNTPLHLAVEEMGIIDKGPVREALLRDLLEAQVALDIENDSRITPLGLAVWNKDQRSVKTLLQAGASPDVNTHFMEKDSEQYRRMHLLYLAIARGDEGVIKALLAAGADPDMKRTLIMTAQEFETILGIDRPLKAGKAPDTLIKISLTPRRVAQIHNIEHLLPPSRGVFTKPAVNK